LKASLQRHNWTMVPLAIALTVCLGQSKSGGEVQAARALAKQAEDYSKRHLHEKKMFALRGDPETWVKMATEEGHLDTGGMWRDDISLVAFVWVKDGHTFFVTTTAGSPSGDWSAYRASVYRTDGTLAHSFTYFAAFSPVGGVAQFETAYDSHGKLVFSETHFKDLKGANNLSAENAKQLKEHLVEIPVYRRVSELPFVNLISRG